MSRKFLLEAEELAKRAPDVLYHAGEPALWALVLLEAGMCPAKQAEVLYNRVAGRKDCLLRRFAEHMARCFLLQEQALRDANNFLLLREGALRNISEANALADMLYARSKEYQDRRDAQAKALRDLFDMKKIED